jgi:hypothetical protein
MESGVVLPLAVGRSPRIKGRYRAICASSRLIRPIDGTAARIGPCARVVGGPTPGTALWTVYCGTAASGSRVRVVPGSEAVDRWDIKN